MSVITTGWRSPAVSVRLNFDKYLRMNDMVDLKKITAEAVEKISNMSFETRSFFNRTPRKIDVNPGMIRKMLLETVWEKGIDCLKEKSPGSEPLAAEKAMSLLLKRDASIKVTYKKGSIRANLPNSEYRFYKIGPQGAAYGCPWPFEHKYELGVTGRVLADFLQQFDAEIPEIVSYVRGILSSIEERRLEEKKLEVENAIKKEVIHAIIEKYIEPLGWSARYSLGEDNMVSMDITQKNIAHLEVPIHQLAESVKDPDALRPFFAPAPPEPKLFDDNLIL